MFFLWSVGLIVEGKPGWYRFLVVYLFIGAGQSAIEQSLMLFLSDEQALLQQLQFDVEIREQLFQGLRGEHPERPLPKRCHWERPRCVTSREVPAAPHPPSSDGLRSAWCGLGRTNSTLSCSLRCERFHLMSRLCGTRSGTSAEKSSSFSSVAGRWIPRIESAGCSDRFWRRRIP